MNKDLLPAKKESPKSLSDLQIELSELERSVSENNGSISTLKNTIYNGGADIEKVGNILGAGWAPPSTNSVKAALTSINSDFTSSFRNTSTAIGHLNDNLCNTLNIIKYMIICMGQITYNQRKDKQASDKAVERLKDLAVKIEKGEINLSELIDIFAENVEAEAKEYIRLEDKLTNLQSEWHDIQIELNDKLKTILLEAESLEKSHDSYITDINKKLSDTITDIKNKQEEASSLLKNEQKESLDRIEKHFTDSLAEIKRSSEELVKSQEKFVSQSKEQTSLALSEFQKEAKHKTAELQEQTDGFIENQNALFEKMKKQQKFYKAVSITALAVSIASLLYGIIL
jgi:hypothetical protein